MTRAAFLLTATLLAFPPAAPACAEGESPVRPAAAGPDAAPARTAAPAAPFGSPSVPAPVTRVSAPAGGGGTGPALPAPEVMATTWTPAQGEPVVVSVAWGAGTDNAVLRWKGRRYPMRPEGGGRFLALIGPDLLDPPGRSALAVEASAGGAVRRVEVDVDVLERSFPVQRLTLPKRLAEFDEPTVRRIEREAKALAARLDREPGPPLWRGPLVPPVEDFRPSGFGARRIINGEPRAPHAGVDITLPPGTPVFAIADGEVAFAGEQFFGGKSVVLDHGGGIFSIYYHLRDYRVSDQAAEGVGGQRVAAGETIGSVGATGRAAGPHLHFGVRVPGGRVDPGLLFGPGAR